MKTVTRHFKNNIIYRITLLLLIINIKLKILLILYLRLNIIILYKNDNVFKITFSLIFL